MSEQTTPQPRSALAILGEINRGGLVEEMSHIMSGLSRDVLATGKTGIVTLKLTVRPSKVADNGVEVLDTLTVSVPKMERKPSLFFASSDGDLTRNDPNQMEMNLKVASIGQAKAKASNE